MKDGNEREFEADVGMPDANEMNEDEIQKAIAMSLNEHQDFDPMNSTMNDPEFKAAMARSMNEN